MRSFILYGRPECHLCDVAKALLDETLLSSEEVEVEYQYVDISTDKSLLLKYGAKIPVLEQRLADGELKRLFWPFSGSDIIALLKINS